MKKPTAPDIIGWVLTAAVALWLVGAVVSCVRYGELPGSAFPGPTSYSP